jgi:exopolysaccharide biosynthesis polyprenyl glycosylphosphotransferase
LTSELQPISLAVEGGPPGFVTAPDPLAVGVNQYSGVAALLPPLAGTARGIDIVTPHAAESSAADHGVTASRLLRRHLIESDLATAIVCWESATVLGIRGPIVGRLWSAGVAALVTVLALYLAGAYRSRHCLRVLDELWRVLVAALVGGAALMGGAALVGPMRRELWIGVAVAAAGLGLERRTFARWLRFERMAGRHLRGVVLVGANADGECLRRMLSAEPELGYVVTGVVGNVHGIAAWTGLPSRCSIEELPGLVADTGASGIVVVPSAMASDDVRTAIRMAAMAGLHVQVWCGGLGVARERLASTPLSGEPFFYVKPANPPLWKLALKRGIDVAGATLGLLVCAPIIGLAAVAVRLEDGGPGLHRGERIGRDGEPFVVYKLRSMTAGDQMPAITLVALNQRTDGPLFKAAQDPRITRTGRIIRALSIDELPQLWNVLQGTMSLVGPRPALPAEVAQFDRELMRRHAFRPGMTGLWQVEARYNPSFLAYRRLDLRYVDNWSLGMDFWILGTTLPAIAFGALRASRQVGN